MAKMPKNYNPPIVSRRYRFDWQYGVDITKQTSLRVVSLFLFLMPVLLEIRNAVSFNIPNNLWLYWGSSVAFILALLILYWCCPRFIRDYRDYGEYKKRGHSHRWIVWEFYNNVTSLSNWRNLLVETKAKGLSCGLDKLKKRGVKQKLEEAFAKSNYDIDVAILTPVNIDRDIYMPIRSGKENLVLYLEESDPELEQKEKELYWILYSQAAKQNKLARVVFWIFAYLSLALAFLPMLNNIRKVIFE